MRINRRREKPSDEVRISQLEAKVAKMEETQQREQQISVLLTHIVGTVADLRDSASIANAELHAGNIRDSIRSFYDAVEGVCDVEDKMNLLVAAFPEYKVEIEQAMKRRDGHI